jgi:hypothetical protein
MLLKLAGFWQAEECAARERATNMNSIGPLSLLLLLTSQKLTVRGFGHFTVLNCCVLTACFVRKHGTSGRLLDNQQTRLRIHFRVLVLIGSRIRGLFTLSLLDLTTDSWTGFWANSSSATSATQMPSLHANTE